LFRIEGTGKLFYQKYLNAKRNGINTIELKEKKKERKFCFIYALNLSSANK